MLIVLMAIIDFSRTKIHAATRWLWLALSGGMFVAAPVACGGNDGNGDGDALDAVTVLDTQDVDSFQPEYGPPEDIYIMETLYGPPPDLGQDPGRYDDIQILYGPPPDVFPADEGQIQDLYGAPPDYSEFDQGAVDIDQPMYGPVMDISENDVPADIQILYGPPAK